MALSELAIRLGVNEKQREQDDATSEGEFELGARYGVTTVTELSFNGEPE
jgi:hypothetical protein